MEANLVGYLLDSLDAPTRREVEAYLQTHPAARAQLARLRQALEPLTADREPPASPPDLVVRTLARVAEHICTDRQSRLPQAPAPRFETPVLVRRWWFRADVLVAACLIVTVLGAGIPALLQLRS